jgi:hypothetical protein
MRRTSIVAAVVAAILAVGAVAMAAIPSADGTIHGCRDNRTGALRVIDAEAGQSCTTKETALTWNQTGPVGPPGLAGVHVIGLDVFNTAFNELHCPAGETAIDLSFAIIENLSGEMSPGFNSNMDHQEQPILTDGRPTGYRFMAGFGFSNSHARFYVTCAVTA